MGRYQAEARSYAMSSYDIPHRAIGESADRESSTTADPPKARAVSWCCCVGPIVDSFLDPGWDGYSTYPLAFTYKVNDEPSSISEAKMVDIEIHKLAPSQATSEQESEYGTVSLAATRLPVRCSDENSGLLCAQPMSCPCSELSDAGHLHHPTERVGANEPTLVADRSQPPNRHQATVDG